MHPIALSRPHGRPLEILCIGAHCDDIEIGCGATLLALQQRHPDCRVHWFVLTSTPAREREALVGAGEFVQPRSRGTTTVCDLRDGHLPALLPQVKERFEGVRATVEPDLVLTHHGLDRHQDHSLVSQVTWQTFRDHMIWEYEIPKFDGDLTTPNVYVALTEDQAQRKVDAIVRAFASQTGKSWFRAENLLALMRLRGVECRSPSGLAEGFHSRKAVLDLSADGTTESETFR